MKRFCKKIIFFLVSTVAPQSKKGAVILMYHSVSDSKAFFAVTADEFEKQMKYLRDKRYVCVKFSELVKKIKAQENLANVVCVTFDDGYEDNLVNALPILEKYSISATIFVSTGDIGKMRTTSRGDQLPVMNEALLKEINKSSFIELMPHGHMHEHLAWLDIDSAKNDISKSQEIVTRIVGYSEYYFAYPYGNYKEETLKILSDLDITAAVTSKEGVANYESPLLELPRMAVTRKTSFSEFVLKVSKPQAYLAAKKLFKHKKNHIK